MKKHLYLSALLYLFALLSSAHAQEGINSVPGSDLPLGAAGQRVMTITGGQTSGVPVGNVGIGTQTPRAKLDVAGEIRSGSTNAACTATNAGAMRYNADSRIIEFCNGSAWTQMGGGAQTGTLCGWGRTFSGAERGPCRGCCGSTVVACMGYSVVSNRCGTSCPPGYTGVSLFSDSANAGDGSYGNVTCVKN